jgi:hypothetical protein
VYKLIRIERTFRLAASRPHDGLTLESDQVGIGAWDTTSCGCVSRQPPGQRDLQRQTVAQAHRQRGNLTLVSGPFGTYNLRSDGIFSEVVIDGDLKKFARRRDG